MSGSFLCLVYPSTDTVLHCKIKLPNEPATKQLAKNVEQKNFAM